MQIIEREAYQRWQLKFGTKTKHIYANSSATKASPIMMSSAAMQARLNCIHSKIFPLPLCPSSNDIDPVNGNHGNSKGSGSIKLHSVKDPEADDDDLHKIGLLGGGKLPHRHSVCSRQKSNALDIEEHHHAAN